MEAANLKEEAKRLVEQLPDDATWDDLMHEIYVRQAIEAGLEDSRAGRVSSIEDVRSRLGLSQP
jgi:predicted transcriptional regulator